MAKTIVRRGRSSAKPTTGRRTRRTRRDEEEFEDPDDEETGRGGRAARRAAKGKTSSSGTKRSRSRDDDDEEVDEEDRVNVKGGWKEAERQRAKSQRDFGTRLVLDKTPQLIKFLEAEPFASYRRHWIEREPNEQGKRGKQSWPCAEEGCPLCELGDEPRYVDLFNVLVFGKPKEMLDEPENMYLESGVKLSSQIQEMAKDEKVGPLDKPDGYFSIARTGNPKKVSTISYNIRPVKERDLDEDWDIDVPDEDLIEEAMDKLYDADTVIGVVTRTQLREVAAEAAGEDLEVEED